jgi:hypothetical protein
MGLRAGTGSMSVFLQEYKRVNSSMLNPLKYFFIIKVCAVAIQGAILAAPIF